MGALIGILGPGPARQSSALPSRRCMPARLGRGPTARGPSARCVPRGQMVGGATRLGGEHSPAGGRLCGDRPMR
eukprot:172602-Prymnesium_polylepis.1